MEKGEFAYYKLEFSDFETIKDSLPPEQGMILIGAIVEYAKSGTVVEVPQEAKLFYAMLRKKQDRAKAKYDELCQKNRENGAAGGKAKARNAKAKADGDNKPKKFKPPTLTQFKNAVKRFLDEDLIMSDDVDDYDIESFYDKLTESGWKIGGTAIQNRSDWESAVRAKFYCSSIQKTPDIYYNAFCYLFSTYPSLKEKHGSVQFEYLLDDFVEDNFERNAKTWRVNDQVFQIGEWKSALDAFVADQFDDPPQQS